jgi:hypothetical protein
VNFQESSQVTKNVMIAQMLPVRLVIKTNPMNAHLVTQVIILIQSANLASLEVVQ